MFELVVPCEYPTRAGPQVNWVGCEMAQVGLGVTVSLNDRVVLAATLVATRRKSYVPAAAVASTTRLLPTIETPDGAPGTVNVIGGVPVAVRGKLPPIPSAAVKATPLVITGGLPFTVRVKFCGGELPALL